jgi:hypothetical protein
VGGDLPRVDTTEAIAICEAEIARLDRLVPLPEALLIAAGVFDAPTMLALAEIRTKLQALRAESLKRSEGN